MAKKYEIADMVRMSAAFTVNGVATDPTTVTLKIKPPVGEVITYLYGTDEEVKKASIGNYYCDFVITDDGTWFFKWYGTGDAYAADQGSFVVNESQFE